MEVTELVAQLRSDTDRMAAVSADTSLDAAVPSCPGWVLRDLLRHLGGVHTWAHTYVAESRLEPIRESLEDQVGGWPDDSELVTWFRDGGMRLAAGLDAAPDDLEAWTFLAAPSPRAHWARRQTHETAIHRVDAELAAGVTPLGFPAEIATDGIDEMLCAFIERPRRGPRHDRPVSVAIATSDTAVGWTVRFDEESSKTMPEFDDKADLIVGGTADALYRWVWNRLDASEVDLTGDVALADVWRSTVAVRW